MPENVETLHSDGSGRDEDNPMHDPSLDYIHLVRRRFSPRIHLLHRITRPSRQQSRPPQAPLHHPSSLLRSSSRPKHQTLHLSRESLRPIDIQKALTQKAKTRIIVDTARYVVKMLPISMTFILCGVVSSVGHTYFVEQASHMNRRVGRLKLPFLAIKLLSMYFEACHDSYLNCIFKREWFPKRFAMGVAMLYSVLCCIIAAIMEERRLRVVRHHGLVGKPDEVEVPMHVAWLVK